MLQSHRVPGTLVLVIVVTCLLGGCINPLSFILGTKQFDEDNPYALKVREFRLFLHAQQLETRLDKLGVDAYIVHAAGHDDGGRWFKVLTGAEDDIADIRELQQEIVAKHQIEDMTIVVFTDFAEPPSVNLDPDLFREVRVEGNRPAIDEVHWDAMSRYPVSNFFNVESMAILATPDDPEKQGRYLRTYTNVNLDLPRGVSKKHLRTVCDSISEVVLRDNLYGDQVTINILKMRLNHGITGDITSHFADLVLDTGTYRTEEKIPLKIRAEDKLTGYKVIIEPKPGYVRTYIMVADKGQEWVYFSQSTDKGPEEMLDVLEQIGRSEGMLEYAEFYNTVHSVPDRLMPEDIFVGFSLRRLGWSYARSKKNAKWARACVGHWAAQGHLNHADKGSWTYGIYDLLSIDKVGWVEQMYTASNSGLGRTDIYGTQGNVVTTQRYSKRRRRYNTITTEVNWVHDRYTVMIDNTESSWLGRQDLVNRGNTLQLNRVGAYAWDTGEQAGD